MRGINHGYSFFDKFLSKFMISIVMKYRQNCKIEMENECDTLYAKENDQCGSVSISHCGIPP